MRKPRRRPPVLSPKCDGHPIFGALVGGMAGAILCLLAAAHHGRAIELVPRDGYSIPRGEPEDCDHDPVIAWSMLGLVVGSCVGAVSGIVSASLPRKEHSEET